MSEVVYWLWPDRKGREHFPTEPNATALGVDGVAELTNEAFDIGRRCAVKNALDDGGALSLIHI